MKKKNIINLYLRLLQCFKDLFFLIRRKFGKIFFNVTSGKQSLGDKLCVFVVFRPNGILKTTFEYIRHLSNDLGYSICLVSNCRLSEDDKKALHELCYEIIERENVGYDFGAYKDGILRNINNLKSLDSLLLVNDSIVAPLYDMTPMFERQNANNNDFWGITEAKVSDKHLLGKLLTFSYQEKNHICSFFLCFKKQVFTSDAFLNFWKNWKYITLKKYVIYRGELGLSQKLLLSGFRYTTELDLGWRSTIHLSEKDEEIVEKSYVSLAGMLKSYPYCHPYVLLKYTKHQVMKRDGLRRKFIKVEYLKDVILSLEGIKLKKDDILKEFGL